MLLAEWDGCRCLGGCFHEIQSMRYVFKLDFFCVSMCLWSSACKGTSHEWATMVQVVPCSWGIALNVKWIVLQAVHIWVTEVRGQLWKRSPWSKTKSGKSENFGFRDPRTATCNWLKQCLNTPSSRSIDPVVGGSFARCFFSAWFCAMCVCVVLWVRESLWLL